MRAIDDLEQSQRKFLSEISNIQSKFIEQRNNFHHLFTSCRKLLYENDTIDEIN